MNEQKFLHLIQEFGGTELLRIASGYHSEIVPENMLEVCKQAGNILVSIQRIGEPTASKIVTIEKQIKNITRSPPPAAAAEGTRPHQSRES